MLARGYDPQAAPEEAPEVELLPVPVDDGDLTADLAIAIGTVDAWLPQLEGDTVSLAYGLRNLDALLAALRSIRKMAAQMAYRSLPERTVSSSGKVFKQKVPIEGFGTVEPVHAQREWVDPQYVRAMQACIRVGMDAGEINHPNDVAALVAEIVSFNGFKSNPKQGTGLAKYVYSQEDSATEKLGDPSVRII